MAILHLHLHHTSELAITRQKHRQKDINTPKDSHQHWQSHINTGNHTSTLAIAHQTRSVTKQHWQSHNNTTRARVHYRDFLFSAQLHTHKSLVLHITSKIALIVR